MRKHRPARFVAIVTALLLSTCVTLAAGPASVRYVADEGTGDSLAAVVSNAPLIHTAQVTAPAAGDAAKQARAVLDGINERVAADGGDPRRLARLHVVAATAEAAEAVRALIRERYPSGNRPPVTMIVAPLHEAGAVVAVDAVAPAFSSAPTRPGVREVTQHLGAKSAVLPPGAPVLFVSGQAEKATMPVEAAAKTIASLVRTLEFAGSTKEDVVQAKCFLTPITSAKEVAAEFDKVFGPGKVPLVFVDWKSNLPIEIELVARGRAGKDAPVLEFLMPPGMTASPIYARVTRVSSDTLIFTSGSSEKGSADAGADTRAAFERLKNVLGRTNSDLLHLAKATYYVTTDGASKALNDVRPSYYDPKRPPAASKAALSTNGEGIPPLTMDFIAVPAKR